MRDFNGNYFHIDKQGNELYPQRYAMIEPFYNGFALVEDFENIKLIMSEHGEIIYNLDSQ
ncbi:hypothetical protein C5S36_04270 [Candidatus Methanophagaceae archaeon]|nr:hypothetical protein C5S36_04270 [Methanophagales archaeon]